MSSKKNEKNKCCTDIDYYWFFVQSPLALCVVFVLTPGVIMLSFGVVRFMQVTEYNNRMVATNEYFETWKHGYYEELGIITPVEIILDSIPKANNTLVLCDTITSDFLQNGYYSETQCLQNVCIEQGGCHPCDYICESSVCLVKEQQETCVAQMAVIGCTVTYSSKTVYVCPNYPTEVLSECLAECNDIQCNPYGSCGCTNCTNMGLRVFNFARNVLATISGQFKYLANDTVLNNSQVYNYACGDAHDQNCGVMQLLPDINLQGHSVDSNCCTAIINPLIIYYNRNDPSITTTELMENSGNIALIIFGTLFTLVALGFTITFVCVCCNVCE
ncbi:MAG: hypothetical protein Harvfovirus5_28 [Harvfovirus sp.]|uniref:Uncharacterized protein n=1 Tax=Harvfovirus sp. TaxID=2487768 RepID=A0A3G5A2J6_9VIRU|nr:MAG: hypothetical protein Harvfovirus5_28 [Harvfovirus sp.]